MATDYDRLKQAALNPFSTSPALGAAELALGHEPDTIANGAWWMCEGCCDPGPDEFPEVASAPAAGPAE